MTVEDFCKWRYGRNDDSYKPTVSHRNTVTWMCRQGTLPAKKIGRRWEISDEVTRV